MRRPVLYLAGLLLATGASLALAGPASAAPSDHHCNKGHHHYMDDEYYNDGYPDWYYSNSTDIDNNHDNNAYGLLVFNDILNGGNLGGLL